MSCYSLSILYQTNHKIRIEHLKFEIVLVALHFGVVVISHVLAAWLLTR